MAASNFGFNPTSELAGRVVNSYTASWTSNGSGDASVTTDVIRGVILRVTTNPGSPAPTDGYDITIADAAGVTILSDTDRDTANSESLYPADSTTGFPIAVSEALTITIANAGSGKTGEVVIYFR